MGAFIYLLTAYGMGSILLLFVDIVQISATRALTCVVLDRRVANTDILFAHYIVCVAHTSIVLVPRIFVS